MIEQVKLFSMSGVLAILIWAVADSLVNETAVVRVAVADLTPLNDPDYLYELDADTKSQILEVHVSGPRQAIDDLREYEPLPARFRLSENKLGPTAVTLDRLDLRRDLGEQWAQFEKLSILTVSPPTLSIVVDRMVHVEVDLVLRNLLLSYAEQPQLSRTTVNVTMRQSLYDSLPRKANRPFLDLSADLERLLSGKPTDQTVSLRIALNTSPFGPGATLNPTAVEVTASVQSQRSTVEIPAVVKPAVNFANLASAYRAVDRDGSPLDLFTVTIKVTGPTEDIQRLLRNETRAYGFVQIKDSDLQQLGVLRGWTADFVLPTNIELADEPPPIEFQLIDGTNPDKK